MAKRRMKKVIMLIMVFALLFSLAACSKNSTTQTASTPADTEEDLQKVPTEEELLNLLKEGNLPEGYVIEDGYLKGPDLHKSVHLLGKNIPEEYKLLRHSEYCDVYRSGNTLIRYRFGNETLVMSDVLPEGALFGGYSFWYGFLFRDDTDVYAVDLDGYTQEYGPKDPEFKLLVSGVKMILEADYKLNSDAWSNPLLLMEDGRVVAYCDWGGDSLHPITYEGGYGGDLIT